MKKILFALIIQSLLLLQILAQSEFVQLGQDIIGGTTNESLGEQVALSGDGKVLAVAAAGFSVTPGGKQGKVEVYEWDGSDWQQKGNAVFGIVENEFFGIELALSNDGNRFVASSTISSVNGEKAGRAAVYEWDGSDWSQMGDSFLGTNDFLPNNGQMIEYSAYLGTGISLSADGSRVGIGVPGALIYNADGDFYSQGEVLVYDWSGTSWNLVGADLNANETERFGLAVALSSDGETLAVQAEISQVYQEFRTYVYRWTNNAWVLDGNPVESAGSFSAMALSDDGARLAIGETGDFSFAEGRAKVYEYMGGQWMQMGTDLTEPMPVGEGFGHYLSLSADGSRLLVGSPFASSEIVDPLDPSTHAHEGKIRLYEWNGSNWNQISESICGVEEGAPSDEDLMGWAVSLSDNGQVFAGSASRYSESQGLARVWGVEDCESLSFFVNADCVDDFFYDLTITFGGGLDFGGYTLINNNTAEQTIFEEPGSLEIDGIAVPNGYSYTLVLNADPSCTESQQLSMVDCVTTSIELIDFSGLAEREGNLIKWETASEHDCKAFVLERAKDGREFSEIASLDCAGESNTQRSYDFLDETDLKTAYYRLRENNTEGKTQIVSEVISIERNKLPVDLSISPNPVSDVLNLYFEEETSIKSLKIYNTSGACIYEKHGLKQEVLDFTIEVDQLPSGVYYLNVQTTSDVLLQEKFLK